MEQTLWTRSSAWHRSRRASCPLPTVRTARPRAHAQCRDADPARDAADCGTAFDLHRRAAREILDIAPQLLGGGRAPYRRAARRCPGGAGHLRAHPDGFAYAADLVRASRQSATSTSRWPPTLRSTPRRRTRISTGQSTGQDRRGRESREHAVLLRPPTRTCAYRDRCVRSGIARKSCRASCRSRAFPQCCASQSAAARACPSGCKHAFDGLDDDADTRRMIAASFAIEQVRRLQEHGVQEFHFYT